MSKQSGIKSKLKQAAEKTGLNEDKIGVIRLQLSALRNLGLAVDLEVTGMSLGVTSASMAEFGIADEDERLKRLRGGTKLLWREEYYKEQRSCESSYRQLLKKYSYKVAGCDWVPFTAWDDYRAEGSIIESRFKSVTQKIIANLDAQRNEYECDVRKMYTQAWAAIKSQDYDAIKVHGVIYKRPAEFVEDMTRSAMKKFPTVKQIETLVRMDYRTSIIGDVADFEADNLRAEKLKTQIVKEKSRQAKAESEANAKLGDLEAKREAIRQAEKEHRLKQLAAMKSPLDDLANAMRQRVGEAVAGMLESIKKNGSLRGKVAEQVLNLQTIYKAMSVTSDPEIEKAMSELTTLVGTVGKERGKAEPKRDIEGIRAAMLEIVEITNKEIETVAIADRLAMLEF